MGKGTDEIAAEIVQALLQARGVVIADASAKKEYLAEYLSDEAAAQAYKTVVKAVNNPHDAE